MVMGGLGMQVSLEQKPVAVTFDLIDVRILNSQEALFEIELVIVYEWKDDTVTSDTPIKDIIIPPVIPRNKIRNRNTYPDSIVVLGDSIQRIVYEVGGIGIGVYVRVFGNGGK